MPRLSMIPTLLRETLYKEYLPREPEPDLVMDDEAQVAAYAEAGRIDGVMSAAYLFQTARISQVIAGSKVVIDLGCGPATQLSQVAQFNPDASFLGVDLSPQMLTDAKAYTSSLNLKNISFTQGDITSLQGIEDNSADAVMSTMAIHHLPTHQHLERCFQEIARVLKPDGALYLTDFARFKSLYSVLSFAYSNKKYQPHLFSLDYERSLRAAFLKSDFARCAAAYLPTGVETLSTFGIPILQIVKTADRELAESTKKEFKRLRQALVPRYRRELDDIRLFFSMAGLGDDPFK